LQQLQIEKCQPVKRLKDEEEEEGEKKKKKRCKERQTLSLSYADCLEILGLSKS